MPVNVNTAVAKINALIAASGLSELENLQLLAAVDLIENNSVDSVANIASLPAAAMNTGRLVYVDDIQAYRYSDGETWTDIFDSTETIVARELWTWGDNLFGQLGDSTTTDRSSPGTVSGAGTDWKQVSDSERHTAAIKTDGTLWTWGYNSRGRLGDGTTTGRSSPGTTAGAGTDWDFATASDTHTAAVKTDGTLWTWGNNTNGELGIGTVTIGQSSPGTTAGGGTDWTTASAGQGHTAAVKTDGTLWTWGDNADGQLGDGTETDRSSPGTVAGGGTNWESVSAGSRHTAAVKTDGTLWTWGFNLFGQLGDGTMVDRSSPGTTAGSGTDWAQASASSNHTGAVKFDGTLWTWGNNSSGRLGDGTTTDRSSPGTTAGSGTDWLQVSSGASHMSAVKTDGTLWTWGDNGNGELGDGTVVDRSSPGTVIGGISNWIQTATGRSTAAIAATTKGF